MTFKVSYWESKFHVDCQTFAQGKFIYVTTQYNFLIFGNVKKILTYILSLLKVPCYRNLELLLVHPHVYFISVTLFLNRSKSMFTTGGIARSGKAVSENQFNACSWLNEIYWDKNYCWITVASIVLGPVLKF